ncbi:MAG: D-alanyl-D-alanine carboxypeptidase [Clostridiales bacterium]|nr:D-alanyl-D-alanine carboxypeptidase [Clostridiales bacterium]
MCKILSFVFAVLFSFEITAFAADNSALSAVVIDACTHEILYAKNSESELSMASTTKIMTALLACESGRLDETVTITAEMTDVIGSAVGLAPGDEITLYDITVGMLLASGNDAANSAAIFLCGSVESFAELMNERAAEIGMNNTLFVTPSGLDEGEHHSTAYDMALLAAQALQNETFAQICKMTSAEITINSEKLTLYNHNKLLYYADGCIGIKTGYTDKAGRCLVSAAVRNGVTLICVTLNDPNDWEDHVSLYDECFAKYEKAQISAAVEINVVGAVCDSFEGEYTSELYVTDESKISVQIYHFPFYYAPLQQGECVGVAVIMYNGVQIAQTDIVSKGEVEYYEPGQ